MNSQTWGTGLVGLCSEEVLELMAEDYPQKYQEYIAVVQEREFQTTLRRKTMESKRMALLVRPFIVVIGNACMYVHVHVHVYTVMSSPGTGQFSAFQCMLKSFKLEPKCGRERERERERESTNC